MSQKATVIESRVAYEGRIFQAVVERVRLPHRDADSTVEIVRHAGSVVIAAMPAPDACCWFGSIAIPRAITSGSCPLGASIRARRPRRRRDASATKSWASSRDSRAHR